MLDGRANAAYLFLMVPEDQMGSDKIACEMNDLHESQDDLDELHVATHDRTDSGEFLLEREEMEWHLTQHHEEKWYAVEQVSPLQSVSPVSEDANIKVEEGPEEEEKRKARLKQIGIGAVCVNTDKDEM
jgi:hypothetical protein